METLTATIINDPDTPLCSREDSLSNDPSKGYDCIPRDCRTIGDFENILNRLYDTCTGCEQKPLIERIESCPSPPTYYKSGDESSITPLIDNKKISCTQTLSNEFSNKDNLRLFKVSSKTIPLLFFNEDGLRIDFDHNGNQIPRAGVPKKNYSQEQSSITNIFGGLTNGAIPPRKIDVTIGRTYNIYVNSPSQDYKPCALCFEENEISRKNINTDWEVWNSSFSAFPSGKNAKGAQATGFITSRFERNNNDNTSLGNYEDTIFGRACFVPPTMLPFSHTTNSDMPSQRQNRQNVQAILFANGYQKDWFGFNLGALIGSFDGISWFAIGSGTSIRASSDTLFIAFNNPFGDYASEHIYEILISEKKSSQQQSLRIPIVNYDENLERNDLEQQQAGICGRYHSCDTDRDCIAKLGHQYKCLATSTIQTLWPEFSTQGKEDNRNNSNLLKNLLPNLPLNQNRCVYRGAGAICAQFDDKNLYITNRHLTCSANFHCAPLGSKSFNDNIVRSLNEIADDNTNRFGHLNAVLGRPQKYYNAKEGLQDNIQTALLKNIMANISDNTITITSTGTPEGTTTAIAGLCRPGINSSTTTKAHLLQNNPPGPNDYPDFLSQVGVCLSTTPTNATGRRDGRRDDVRTCPVLDGDGNLVEKTGLNDNDIKELAFEQFVCSGYENSNPNFGDLFDDFYLNGVDNIYLNISSPKIPSNICLKQAGTPCHTDLECYPSRLHAENSEIFDGPDIDNFTRDYFEEYLVCGQSSQTPSRYQFRDSSVIKSIYNNHSLKTNRCCRLQGNDISVYSKTAINNITTRNYPRFQILKDQEPLSAEDNAVKLVGTPSSAPNEWRKLNTINQKTCCGGTWIRKFNNDTNAWPIVSSYPYQIFKCLNYNHYIAIERENIQGPIYNQYKINGHNSCNVIGDSHTDNACLQIPIVNTNFSVSPDVTGPIDLMFSGSITIVRDRTDWADDHDNGGGFIYSNPIPLNQQNFLTVNSSVSIFTPWFLTGISEGDITMNEGNANIDGNSIIFTYTTTIPNDNDNGEPLEFEISTSFFKKTMKKADRKPQVPGNDIYYLLKLGVLELTGIPQIRFPSIRCNHNNNKLLDIYVPSNEGVDVGIREIEKNLTQTFIQGQVGNNPSILRSVATNIEGINRSEIFSPHKFKCCIPLGETTESSQNCCSGHSVLATSAQSSNQQNRLRICKLPPKTDLHVYFNLYVSNEGIRKELEGNRLIPPDEDAMTNANGTNGTTSNFNDFNPFSGEPLYTTSVTKKIRALGNAHCDSGTVRRGRGIW